MSDVHVVNLLTANLTSLVFTMSVEFSMRITECRWFIRASFTWKQVGDIVNVRREEGRAEGSEKGGEDGSGEETRRVERRGEWRG